MIGFRFSLWQLLAFVAACALAAFLDPKLLLWGFSSTQWVDCRGCVVSGGSSLHLAYQGEARNCVARLPLDHFERHGGEGAERDATLGGGPAGATGCHGLRKHVQDQAALQAGFGRFRVG